MFTPPKNQHQRTNYYDYYSNTTDSDNTLLFTPQKNQHQRPNYYDYYSNTTDSDNTVYSSVNKKQRLVEKANAPLYYFNPSPADKNRIEQRRLAPGYRRKEEEAEKLFFDITQMKDKLELNNLYRDERTVKKLPGATEVKLFRFVITDTAQLRLGPNQDFEYYSHGSMANGGGVFAAGEMGFDQTGKLRYVSNTTGHYRVPQESLLYVLYPYLMDQYNYSLEDIQSLYQGTWTRSQEDNEDESEYSCELVGERFDYTQCLAIISVNDKQNITENPASIYSTPSKSRTNTSDFSYVTP